MTVAQRLLAEARQAGWVLWVEGGRLRYRAPLGYDPHWLEWLREAKAELIELLGEEATRSQAPRSTDCRPSAPTEQANQTATTTPVYRYRLTDRPDTWLVLIAPGDDQHEARRVLENQFGAARVMEVVENR